MSELITPQSQDREILARLPAEAAASLGRIGPLSVRLARDEAEVRASQRLRHRVFFEASGTEDSRTKLLDADRFDAYCEHLLVIDDSLGGPVSQRIVGTYRLLREERARAAKGYYSENVYDVGGLMSRHPDRRFLELGRSCVLPEYRSKRIVELLWQGIWAYCQVHSIDVMFGCASFAGTVPAAHALALSFLHHNARAKDDWRVAATSATRACMDLIPVEAVDLRTALAAMPPLVKGYLRLGARFGDGAVVDQEFGSTDVFVIVRSEDISARYLNHFGPDAGRFV
jgi:L-ornithine Nalpha-acyltransferase